MSLQELVAQAEISPRARKEALKQKFEDEYS